jgi:hypothetical protein
MSARTPGATRLGFHRQFPLRYRRANLHVTQPPPRHRRDAPRLTLATIAHEFRLSLHPLPTPCGEGGKAYKDTLDTSHKRSSRNWSKNQQQPQKWVRNKNNDWIRASLPDPSKNPFNQAKRQPKCRHILTEKAYDNFHRLLDPHVGTPKQETSPPQRHLRTPATSFQGIKVKGVPLNNKQCQSFEDVFGSPKYLAFVAQDGTTRSSSLGCQSQSCLSCRKTTRPKGTSKSFQGYETACRLGFRSKQMWSFDKMISSDPFNEYLPWPVSEDSSELVLGFAG